MIQTWRIVDPHAISYREWDGELVVYNHATGNTHHLAPLGAAVLLALLHNPAGMETSVLIPLLAGAMDIAEMQLLDPSFQRTMSELADLELVGCVPA